MSAPQRVALAPGVEARPVRELPEALRRELEGHAESVALSAPRTRQTTTLLDPATAELIAEFRRPSSIDAAVRRFARRRGDDPVDVLQQAWSVLESLLRRGILLSADDPRMTAPPVLTAGERVDGWTVVRPIRALDDAQVYLVRGPANEHGALKLAPRPEHSAPIERESALLRELDGAPTPRLLASGALERCSYLVSEWCAGISVERFAQRRRAARDQRAARRALLALARSLAAAYAELHRRGVLHADVHPHNLLVGRDRGVRVIDLGMSRRLADGPLPSPGGMAVYRAPELARALLAGDRPLATPASEQFSIAALIYRLLTGHPTQDFALEESRQLEQSATGGMLPFRHRGLTDWPALEAVLERALDADPDQRHADLRAFARALGGVEATPRRAAPAAGSSLAAATRRISAAMRAGGAWWSEELEAPRVSLQNGAAGVAFAAYRRALIADDAEELALADLWIRRARAAIDAPDAFRAPGLRLTAETVGEGSPQHGASGVHAVEALIARALLDDRRAEAAARAFLAAIERPTVGLDLAVGAASPLASAAALIEALAPCAERDRLRATGERIVGELWTVLEARMAADGGAIEDLGLAHGWAGVLFSTLRWREAVPGGLPAAFAERIARWRSAAEPWGRGLRWPRRPGPEGCTGGSMPGWCAGTAGHLLLACLASRCFDPELAGLAEAAAYDVWDARHGSPSLCCGLLGRAYALLAYHRLSGDRTWARRARSLAELAACAGFEHAPVYSLFRGELSLALIAAELERADASAFPLLEREA